MELNTRLELYTGQQLLTGRSYGQVNLDKAKAERRRVRENREAAQEALLQAQEEERTVGDALSHARKHGEWSGFLIYKVY